MGLQPLQAAAQELAVLVEPASDVLQRAWGQVIDAVAAVAPLENEARPLQDAQVLRDRGAAHGESARERSDRLWPVT